MPPKNQRSGQPASKAAAQASMTSTTANPEANTTANEQLTTDGERDSANSAPTNGEILLAIHSLKVDFGSRFTDILEAMNGIREDLAKHSQRLSEAEGPISQTEDDVATLKEKIKRLDHTVETLKDRIQDQEDRGRRSNVRLVGLPEKSEGSDLGDFLENWLPTALPNTFTKTPVIERAHRIGPANSNQNARARTIIIKFLNYRDREATLKAAGKLGEVRHGGQRVSFFPDLSAETRQRQRLFDAVKTQFRARNIRYGMLYPAHLIITHGDKRRIFKSVKEAEDYIQNLHPAL